MAKAADIQERNAQRTELEIAVAEAQAELLRVAREDPTWWNPQKLRDAAQNGWGGDVMMYALTDLVNRGELVLNEDLEVRDSE